MPGDAPGERGDTSGATLRTRRDTPGEKGTAAAAATATSTTAATTTTSSTS
jgi:hypothetical protein